MIQRNLFYLFICTQLYVQYVHTVILTPPYFNLVANKHAYASATCGEDVNEPELYCKLTGASATDQRESLSNTRIIQGQYCDYCDPNDPEKTFPAANAIDSTDKWWQSPPLSRSLDYNAVNFTIDLGQVFHVAYIYIKMANSPRPGVWALERSTDFGKTFKPWQYFADTPSDCYNFFNVEANKRVERDNDVTCTTEYSKVVPVEGGEILVSLVNNRPSSKNFSNSDDLQMWTRATNVRLRLIRTKTLLGHLMAVVRQDTTVTRRYFYSIRDVSIGGRCVCNGHAQDCEATDPENENKLVCNCQHNTCGDQCETCCPGFVAKKWRQNRENNEFQCEPCQCNGHSEECHYDEEVEKNGQSVDIYGNNAGGGVCDNCQHNTEGINCDKCSEGYYLPHGVFINETYACERCPCNNPYSTGNCEQGTGQCECKKQYTGNQCEMCAEGYYDWPSCRPCDCHVEGRADNTCVSTTGSCNCKYGFDGPYCDKCIDGYHSFPNCKPCECDEDGKLNSVCNKETGDCMCKPGYTGPHCEACDNGYFGDETCTSCDCDGGATDEICHKNNGTCVCKPNYAGERCNECAAGFYNFPLCLPCECDGEGSQSESCTFYSVKQCDCKEGRGGPSCDQCAPGYYQYPECIQCSCDEYGAIGQSCDQKTGKCKCKENFVGDKCSECAPNLYNYPICEECRCHPDGVEADFPGCSKEKVSVICPCKEHVTGRQCDQCKDLYYGLGSNQTYGCTPCECSRDGTLNELDVCDKTTGQCLCKEFAGSLTCSECVAGTFGLRRDELFGCEPCECRIGSSVDNNCDRSTGRCACLPNIIGDKCEEPDNNHYIPNLHQLRFEVEDGYTPSLKAVRYGFNKEQFADYSWKGYVHFNKLQNEVLQDIRLQKLGSFRMILHFINKNSDLSEVLIRVVSKTDASDEQNTTMYLPSASKPEFATVVRNQINAVTFELENDVDYTVSFKTNSDAVFLDYFVLLPSDYFEPNLLKQNIERICRDYNDDLCVQYVYPPLEGFKSTVLADDPNYEDIRRDFEDVKPNHNYRKPLLLVPLDSEKSVTVEVKFPVPAQYVLLVEYHNHDKTGHDVKVNVQHADSRKQMGQSYLYKCDIASLCRQAILSTNLNEPLLVDGNESATLEFNSATEGESLVYRVIAIPKEKFDLNLIKMSPKCILRNGQCTAIQYTRFPQLVKMELESDQPEERHDLITNLKNRKQLELASQFTRLVYMHDFYPEISVPVRTARRDKGDHVMIVHYYQPNHPFVNVSVFVDKSFRGSFEAPNCPSTSGCRSIVKFETGETFDYEDARTLNFQLAQNGKDIWLDYVLFAPAVNVNPDLLKSSPIDFTDEFLTNCASQHFKLEPEKSKFCDDSVFALSTRYNNGAVSCGCNDEGSLGASCEKFGGQCQCKPNVIGRECSRCKPGYYGFPECKECNCPSGNCDDKTGNCICAQNVEEDNCSKCIPGTYGFDPHFGCDDCDCNIDGTLTGNATCNSDNGQCDCRPNVDGRQCDLCKAGFYNYPACNECSCNTAGTTDRICDANYANCLCKESVSGPSCDQCEYGTFNLEARNPQGCTKCFCFGLTDHCISSHFYFRSVSDMNPDNWKLSNSKSAIRAVNGNGLAFDVEQDAVNERSSEAVYWVAPSEYLGRKITTYGGSLRYSVQYTSVANENGEAANPQKFVRPDVVLTGNNMTVAYTSLHQPVSDKRFENTVDLLESRFTFLHTGFSVSREQLMLILNSLTELRIRASYVQQIQSAELHSVQLDQGADQYEYEDVDLNRPATSVERCNCPHLHRGLSCESCAPGYYKQKGSGIGQFTCVPCNCNGKTDVCDEETGECLNCEDNTTGKSCETCKPGYYAIPNGPNGLECHLCPCPGPSEMNIFATGCLFDSNANKVYHCSCLPGYTGQFCERCAPGFYGDPATPGGKCLPCQCNGNIDLRDYGSCDQRTGACLKCLNNSAGVNCEKTAPWHYGDPIVLKNVQPCKCDKCGTAVCDSQSGECKCRANVKGLTCNSCLENKWGFNQCDGCKDCNCDPVGSLAAQCDPQTGYCKCKPGIGGKFCDQCLPDYWNFTSGGCQPCHCDKYGVQSGLSGISCNAKTGDCKCIPGVKGKYCDECDDRWILVKHQGCKSCDTCVHTLLDDLESLFIKANAIENYNSSLLFRAHNKLMELEDQYQTIKTSLLPDSYSNTPIAILSRTIKRIKEELPDVRLVTETLDMKTKILKFNQTHESASQFAHSITELRQRLDSLNRAIEELDRRDASNEKPLSNEDLDYYERIVQDILSATFNESYKSLEESLSKFHESNKTANEISETYNAHVRQMETIKNKTAHLENSLNELRGYIDKAKNLEKFKDRDVTFKAYVDNLNELKANTNDMKQASLDIVESVRDIIRKSEESLSQSSEELKDLDQSVQSLDGLFVNHNENFDMLKSKYLEANQKATLLASTAQTWKNKVAQSEQGLQAYEMARVYDKIANTLVSANTKSKDVLDKYQRANETLAEFLRNVADLNARNEAVSEKSQNERERKQASERELEELNRQYTNLEGKVKSLGKQIGEIDQWVIKTKENENSINDFRKNVDKQENDLEMYSKSASDTINRVESLHKLKDISQKQQEQVVGGDVTQNANIANVIDSSIDELSGLNEKIDIEVADLKKREYDYGIELDQMSEMIYNLKVLIDSTRDIANEIRVAVKFNDSTVVRLKNSPEFAPTMSSSGSVYVKTQDAYSPIALLYNDNKPSSYMSLYLRDGLPHFHYRLSEQSAPTVLQTNHRINDGKWHKLEFERVGRLAKLKVKSENEYLEASAESKDSAVVFNFDPSQTNFVLGQLNFSTKSVPDELKSALSSSSDGEFHNQFRGAMDTVRLNEEQFGLWNYDRATNIAGELRRTFDLDTEKSSAIRFNEQSFMCMKMKKRVRLQSRRATSVTVGFKTSVSNGLIWLGKQLCSEKDYCDKKYVAVYLKNGYLGVDVAAGLNAKFSLDTSASGKRFNDNQFHTVSVRLAVKKNNGEDYLMIAADVVYAGDEEEKRPLGEVSHSVSGTSLNIQMNEQCLGSVPKHYRDIEQQTAELGDFIGCMNLLTLDIEQVDLQLERLKPSTLSSKIGSSCSDSIEQCSFKKSNDPTYVAFDANVSSVEEKATFGISFVPLSLSGTLLFIRQRELQENEAVNYIYLYLENGRVTLVVKNTNRVLKLVSEAPIAYSELQHVYVVKDGGEFTLSVNDIKVKQILSQKSRLFTNSDLYVGGVPQSERDGISEKFYNYHGCIVGLIYKDQQLKFHNSKSSSLDNLVFDICYSSQAENQLDNQRSSANQSPKAIVQHLSQQYVLQKTIKIKDEECTLSRNYDQTHLKTVGLRFGLTKNSRLEVWENYQLKTNSFISFKFRTLLHDGLIFYASDVTYKDFIAIWLENGYISYAYDCGSGYVHMKSVKAYNDGRYHTVIASRDRQNGMLRVLDRTNTTILETIEDRSPGLDSSLNVIEPYYIGSLPDDVLTQLPSLQTALINTEPYIGCMSEIVIAYKPLKNRVKTNNLMNCSNNHESGLFLTGKPESYATLPTKMFIKDPIEIEFDLKPRTKNGVILYIGGTQDLIKEYLMLELVNGELQYRVSIGGMNNIIKYTPKYSTNELCNANWIRIKVKKDSKGHITLVVRNQDFKPDIDPQMLSFATRENTLYFGSFPNANISSKLSVTGETFVGCIRDLLVTQNGSIKPAKSLLNLSLGQDVLNYCPLK